MGNFYIFIDSMAHHCLKRQNGLLKNKWANMKTKTRDLSLSQFLGYFEMVHVKLTCDFQEDRIDDRGDRQEDRIENRGDRQEDRYDNREDMRDRQDGRQDNRDDRQDGRKDNRDNRRDRRN